MEGRLGAESDDCDLAENNRDLYQTQVESLKKYLTYLLDHYHFSEFKSSKGISLIVDATGFIGKVAFLEKKKVTLGKLAPILHQVIKKCLTIFKIAWEKKPDNLICR